MLNRVTVWNHPKHDSITTCPPGINLEPLFPFLSMLFEVNTRKEGRRRRGRRKKEKGEERKEPRKMVHKSS